MLIHPEHKSYIMGRLQTYMKPTHRTPSFLRTHKPIFFMAQRAMFVTAAARGQFPPSQELTTSFTH